MPRKPLSASLRFKVMKRDGFKCIVCGRAPATTHGLVLEVDHIRPVARGGSNHIDNLRTVCFECNRGKSDVALPDDNQKEILLQSVSPSEKVNEPIQIPGVVVPQAINGGEIPHFAAESIRAMGPAAQGIADLLSAEGWIVIDSPKGPGAPI